MVLNPGRRRLKGGEAGVFVAVSQAELDEALTRSFSRALHPASGTHFLRPGLGRDSAAVRSFATSTCCVTAETSARPQPDRMFNGRIASADTGSMCTPLWPLYVLQTW